MLAAVRAAVADLVQEHGRERITVPMIAERAGVNPTSIYRRWGDLPTLINDMATYRLDPNRSLPESGDLRQDLTDWAREIVMHYSNPANAAMLRGGAATAGARETDCLRNRKREAEVILAHENSSGLTVDEIIDSIVAPITYRVIFLPWTLNDQLAETLVGQLFAAKDATASLTA